MWPEVLYTDNANDNADANNNNDSTAQLHLLSWPLAILAKPLTACVQFQGPLKVLFSVR